RSGSAMWNLASGTTACCLGSGAVGGAAFAANVVAKPRTHNATRGTSVIAQRVQDAARWPGFEEDIDFACMFLQPFLRAFGPCGQARVLGAGRAPRGGP